MFRRFRLNEKDCTDTTELTWKTADQIHADLLRLLEYFLHSSGKRDLKGTPLKLFKLQ